MRIRNPNTIRPSEITDESVYFNRRRFLQAAGFTALGAVAAASAKLWAAPGRELASFDLLRKSALSTGEAANSWEDITTYNNFYEFGTGKDEPHRYAKDFQPHPWEVEVAGECDKPGTYSYEDMVGPHTPEERIYRLRCVEAWSMVIPWVGISLADMLKRFAPNSRAKFVKFTTLHDPARMPGQRWPLLQWPYVEGLRIDEAMHPLTIMALGLYGKELPNQNGAPLRLVVPWKYGFKSIKSIVRIEFTETQPVSAWEQAAPHEYGFYANVNPNVDHPRWSQARERRIGADVFAPKVPTLMFNGYAEQVAGLYAGMDLAKNY
ncbi:MAG: sulfoxide reductase catalytic subunit YedY [Gammaproteobacteria bacterium SG8_31]|jgi:sulfoxide reductase catalytic subunit YedY|nr:MAG: sulfoxide reductase catalytic subunit YedY [Gammaproteobacteria bacterium SG8_31]